MSDSAVTELDTRGLMCPMPILKLKQALRSIASGERIQMIATDPGTESDVPAFCAQTCHRLIESKTEGDSFFYLIEKV